eukprot:305969_1
MPVHHMQPLIAIHVLEHLDTQNEQKTRRQNGWDNHDQKDSDVNNQGFIAKEIKNQQHKQHCFLKNATGTICDDQDHEKWIPHAWRSIADMAVHCGQCKDEMDDQ